MRLFGIICMLTFLCAACQAEDLIFFADDHYKALGAPQLNASAENPVLSPGGSVLRIALANNGQMEELMPINGNGSEADVDREMKEELLCVDALNITAALFGNGPVEVTPGPKHIEALPSGAVAELKFNVSVENRANGWYELPLRLDYEHQVDVSVSEGVVSPLYQPDSSSTGIKVFVPGAEGPLRILETKSDLAPGESGTILAVIKNDRPEALNNCTARLIAAPPFRTEGREYLLGDLPPGGLAVASFSVRVDSNASLQDYQLGCEVSSGKGRSVLSLPVALAKSANSFWPVLVLILVVLIIAAAAFLFMGRRRPRRRLVR